MPSIDLALIICSEGEDRAKIVASALRCGLSPICCSNLNEARTLLPQEPFRVVLCKEFLADGDFRTVLREVKTLTPHAAVIVIGSSPDWDTYLKALGAGAFEYIVCPLNPAEAIRSIWLALGVKSGHERASHAA